MENFFGVVPKDIIVNHVLTYFNEKEVLLNLSLVSKMLEEYCNDHRIWKSILFSKFKRHVGTIQICFQVEVGKEEWKKIFQRSVLICRHLQSHWREFVDDDIGLYDMEGIREFFKHVENKSESEEEEEETFNNFFITFQQLLPIELQFGENNDIKYHGEVVNGLRHGKGTLEFPNGSCYIGNFVFGEKQGMGEFIWKGGDLEWSGDSYIGEFEENTMQGIGLYKYKNGDKYEGSFFNTKKQGLGRYHFSSGASYDGEWWNDQRNGQGIFIFHRFNQQSGNWESESVSSKGLYIWGQQYEGKWKNNEMDGMGTMTFLNGDKYIGEFRKDAICGNGCLFKKNGKSFEGYWEFEKSRGSLMCSNGDEFFVHMDKKGVIHVYKEDEEESEGDDDDDDDNDDDDNDNET